MSAGVVLMGEIIRQMRLQWGKGGCTYFLAISQWGMNPTPLETIQQSGRIRKYRSLTGYTIAPRTAGARKISASTMAKLTRWN